MKRLFTSLSLPIGVIFLLILALFSGDKEGEIKRREEEALQPRKIVKKYSRIMRGAPENDSLIKKNKPYFTTVIAQQLLKWDSLVKPERRAKKKLEK